MDSDENIVLSVEETELEEADSKNDDVSNYLDEFIDSDDIYMYYTNPFDKDLHLSTSLYYMENYTVKDLILICDYYGFSKEIKANKLSKELIIQCLVDWELDMKNYKIVKKRQQLWHYITELKKDKFMKKYVLW
jgi:hypothetical protein